MTGLAAENENVLSCRGSAGRGLADEAGDEDTKDECCLSGRCIDACLKDAIQYSLADPRSRE